MKNKDSYTHVRGESLFVDDINIRQGTLYGIVFDSPVAHGKIIDINYSKAKQLDGIIEIFTYKDIPGENQIGAIIQDEPLLAEKEVHYVGQPIAFIVADSISIAKKAKGLIEIKIEKLPVITTAKQAFEKKSFISPPRTFSLGNTKQAFEKCDYIFEGNAFSNGQEHLYLETQSSYAYPMENGNIKIISSTQGPTAVQKITARVLGIAMHKIEIEVIRLGGGFGGKEDQATTWAAMTALAVSKLKKPVKLILERIDDMRMTGKRHPYESEYKIGLDNNLKIVAFEAKYYQNAGAAADLSPAIAERTLFHATNSYFIPNVKATLYSCKTNLPPNTAFRGFGGPQGMFVIESAIAKAAEKLNIPAYRIQKANLIQDGDEFPYGQIAEETQTGNSWNQVWEKFALEQRIEEIKKYNAANKFDKKGYSLMPVTFGISFTNTMMNHARALVHIYQDGSIGISTGAVEMGQGVNTKMVQIAADFFGLNNENIKIETTNTTRVANTSPTAASATTDLNGKALLKACNQIKKRLDNVIREILHLQVENNISFKNNYIFVDNEKSSLSWEKLIWETFAGRISLSEIGHYATPVINFDKGIEKGRPFAYYVYGTAFTVVKLDCIRGNYKVETVNIVHDFGKFINPGIDYGQVEGALVQGIGWMTMEEIAYDKDGRLLSDTLSTYKVPDIFSAPDEIKILPLKTKGNEMAILKSKAVGEPPLMYGIGTYFAIENAIKAFNPDYKSIFNAPMTPEKVLLGLYKKK